jgi:vancomycin resistance protein YoaR
MAQRRIQRPSEPNSPYFQEYGPITRRRLSGDPEPDAAEQAAPAALPRARRQRRRASPFRALLWLTLALALLVLGPPLAVRAAFGQQVLPGVSVQGMPAQAMSRDELRAALQARYAEFLRRPVTITFGAQRWQPTLAELGARLDLDATSQAAVAVGRSGNPRQLALDTYRLAGGGVDIAPRLSVDATRVRDYVRDAAAGVEAPPQDGALSLAEGSIAATPGQVGRQVLADATADDLLLALSSLEPQTVALRTRTLEPTVGEGGLAQGVEAAQRLLAAPLILRQGERSWVWEADKIAELLAVRRDGSALAVGPDQERLGEAVARLAQLVDTGSVEPRLQLGSDGNLQVIQEGKTGVRLRQEEAAALIGQTIGGEARELQLPVDEVRPQVDVNNLQALGISALIGEGKTSFAGSAAYRITNIKAGASKLHGVLIAPDEEFSFNTTIGEINAENGYVEGYAIIGNRTQLEWGGGICQDSTTVFRAAFWAGLPITERHTHAFRISWYEAFDPIGMDATIYTGVNDLKFINNTGNWLLMQVWVDEAGQVLTVQLYGTPTGRSVRLEGPFISNEIAAPREPVYVDDPSKPAGTIEQTDVARGGMDITIQRIISVDGVDQAPEAFFTRFKAWPNVFVRGTGG